MDNILKRILEVLETNKFEALSIERREDNFGGIFYSLKTYKGGVIWIRRNKYRNWWKKYFGLKDNVKIVAYTSRTQIYDFKVTEENEFYKNFNDVYEKIESMLVKSENENVLKYL